MEGDPRDWLSKHKYDECVGCKKVPTSTCHVCYAKMCSTHTFKRDDKPICFMCLFNLRGGETTQLLSDQQAKPKKENNYE